MTFINLVADIIRNYNYGISWHVELGQNCDMTACPKIDDHVRNWSSTDGRGGAAASSICFPMVTD